MQSYNVLKIEIPT